MGSDYFMEERHNAGRRADECETKLASALQTIVDLEERNTELKKSNQKHCDKMKTVRILVDQQAGDEGLWFIARTAPEGYLQRALRQLHAAIEGKP